MTDEITELDRLIIAMQELQIELELLGKQSHDAVNDPERAARIRDVRARIDRLTNDMSKLGNKDRET